MDPIRPVSAPAAGRSRPLSHKAGEVEAAPSREERIAALEQEYQQCWGTYMYCEAADFQSAEERATSRRMSQRMGEIGRELAHLRGREVLDREHVRAAVDGLLEAHPLARLGGEGFRAAYAAFGLSSSSWSVDSPVQQLSAAMHEGILTKEEVDARVLRSGMRRKATATGAEEEVRREAASLLTRDLPRDQGLFPNLEALLAAASGGTSAAVAGLVRQGRVSLGPEDVNRARRCVYEPGQLGRAVARFRESGRADGLRAVEELLDQPLPYTADERRDALAAAGEHLAKRLGEVSGRPEDDWQVRQVRDTMERWKARGLGPEDLRRGLLGGGAPPESGAIEEGPAWILVGDVRLDRQESS